MIDASDVYNPSDFESVKLAVYLKNSTTRTEVNDTSKTGVLELGDGILVIEAPFASCNKQHNVLVTINQVLPAIVKGKKTTKEKELLSVTGKVSEVEDVGDKSLRVTIECVQYDEESWRAFAELYSSRQTDIENFFNSVRGF